MESRSRLVCRFALAGATLIAVAPSAHAEAPLLYDYVAVAAPAGWDGISLHSVNNLGDAAGVVWKRWIRVYEVVVRTADGSLHLLPTPPGCQPHAFRHVVKINDARQVLVDLTRCSEAPTQNMVWGERAGWMPITLPSKYDAVARAMNDLGEVVGTADPRTAGPAVGFTWQFPDRVTLYRLQDGLGFGGINNRRQVAATVTRDDRPGGQWYRAGGQSAAWLRLRHDPVYTGDAVVDSIAELKDRDLKSHQVNSTAVGINESGAVAISSYNQGKPQTMGCVWRPKQPLACTDRLPESTTAVGVGGAGELVVQTARKRPSAYLYLADQDVHYPLNEVVDPPSLRSLGARAISEAGYITGAPKDRSTRESFILIPKARTAVQALN
jgi:hypothetical protein